MESTLCPLCRSPLQLKQINFTTAIYLCTDLKCPYPVGNKCLVVERHLEGMKHKIGTRSSVGKPRVIEHSPTAATPLMNDTVIKQNCDDFDLDAIISSTLTNLSSESVDENYSMTVCESSDNSSKGIDAIVNSNNYSSEYINPSDVNDSRQLTELEEILDGLM